MVGAGISDTIPLYILSGIVLLLFWGIYSGGAVTVLLISHS